MFTGSNPVVITLIKKRIFNRREINIKKNKYIEYDDYYVGMTNRKGNKFYFDKEDFDLVSQYYWVLNSDGDVISYDTKPQTSMHKLIMGDGQYKHINGMKFDNRKENLLPVRHYKNGGKIILNGYIAIYLPEHSRAFDNGCVYEHILIAEKLLKRQLKKDECVHHIDKNKQNNSENNLMVFATEQDHIRYHGGAKAYLQDDGSYTCNVDGGFPFIKGYNICPVCNKNYKTIQAKMCIECRNIIKSSNIPPKDALEELIYANSFSSIGRMYDVSDNAIRKWCKKYGLPHRRKDINNLLYIT